MYFVHDSGVSISAQSLVNGSEKTEVLCSSKELTQVLRREFNRSGQNTTSVFLPNQLFVQM